MRIHTSTKQNKTQTRKTKKGFSLTDYLIKKLAGQYQVLLLSFDPFFDKMVGLKILLEEKLAYPNVKIKTPEKWETVEIKDKVRKVKKELYNTWGLLSNSREFKLSLNYDGIPLWDILQEPLSKVFQMDLLEAVRWIENLYG